MKYTILVASVSLLCLAACGDSSNDSKFEELNSNRLKWESLNETRYEMTFVYSAFNFDSGTYKTYIEQERVLTVLRNPGNEQNFEYKSPDHLLFERATIADFFDIIEDAIATADEYTVVYDEELGYPTRFFINYSSTLGDDEVEYQVTEIIRGSQLVCADIAHPGITVNLALANTTNADLCDAQILLEDGDYVEQATNCVNNTFEGALERPGNYTISAGYPGYITQNVEEVSVYPFLCSVGNRSVDIVLQTQ